MSAADTVPEPLVESDEGAEEGVEVGVGCVAGGEVDPGVGVETAEFSFEGAG
jgi:hypothetical protein